MESSVYQVDCLRGGGIVPTLLSWSSDGGISLSLKSISPCPSECFQAGKTILQLEQCPNSWTSVKSSIAHMFRVPLEFWQSTPRLCLTLLGSTLSPCTINGTESDATFLSVSFEALTETDLQGVKRYGRGHGRSGQRDI